MLVWYDPKSGEVLGVSALLFDSSKRAPRPERSSSSGPRGAECFEAPEDEEFARSATSYRVELDESRRPVGLAREGRCRIELSTDAADTNGDGVPEIPSAGGVCTVVASIRSESGKLFREALAKVSFVASGGVLSHSSVETKTGIAKVQLSAVAETKRVWVEARAPGSRASRTWIDFAGPAR
jgi:hypothetical protein